MWVYCKVMKLYERRNSKICWGVNSYMYVRLLDKALGNYASNLALIYFFYHF